MTTPPTPQTSQQATPAAAVSPAIQTSQAAMPQTSTSVGQGPNVNNVQAGGIQSNNFAPQNSYPPSVQNTQFVMHSQVLYII